MNQGDSTVLGILVDISAQVGRLNEKAEASLVAQEAFRAELRGLTAQVTETNGRVRKHEKVLGSVTLVAKALGGDLSKRAIGLVTVVVAIIGGFVGHRF